MLSSGMCGSVISFLAGVILTGMLLDLFPGQPLAYGIDEHSDLHRFCDEVIHAFLDEHVFDITDHIGGERDDRHIVIL